ncbi:MAG: hypothetical protein AB7P14_12115 [Blastocatellales bacterium]
MTIGRCLAVANDDHTAAIFGGFYRQIEQVGGGFRIGEFYSAISIRNGLIDQIFHPDVPFSANNLFECISIEPFGSEAPSDPDVGEDRRLISTRRFDRVCHFDKLVY